MPGASAGSIRRLKIFLGVHDPGKFPLHEAVVSGDIVRVSRAIRAGYDVDGVLPEGESPLHLAALCGDTEILLRLLDAGAFANAQNFEGNGPLHFLAYPGASPILLAPLGSGPGLECAAILVERGGLVDLQNKLGQSPLHLAIRSHNEALAELLLKHGANANLNDKDGWAPLHYACSAGCSSPELARLLLGSGADTYLETKRGESPLAILPDEDPDFLAQIEVIEMAIRDHRDDKGCTA